MRPTFTLHINKRDTQRMKKGYPLITEKNLTKKLPVITEGAIVDVNDESGNFLGRGYYGKQNKGIGWILTRNQTEKVEVALFKSRLKTAIEHREKLFQDSSTTAFRVFNGEGDGVGGLTIDYYNEFYVFTWYSEGIYSFKEEIYQAFQELRSFKGIYEKKRYASKGEYIEDDDFVMGERGEFPLLVKENNVQFAVYLNDGPMVGVFLDQRDVRKTIKEKYAKGKTVLNTFSYTGAFSVAGALGGAAKTTSVDLAKRSLSKTIEQFSVNDIDYESEDIVVMDVFQYFKFAKKKQLLFDLVILDPPSFARSKKHTFSAAKDYTGLLQEAIAITNKNGVIVASTNCSTFNMEKFHTFIKEACRKENVSYEVVEQFSLPTDFKTIKSFPEGNYLKVVFLKVKS
ncbi:class I SAM-dependent rRNA methyltransferase [Halalkalibacter akibai]|uniref:LSU m5C1962 methyltransferase RlmI n=1 Tax=Halalkalibacter akibai (strain ATCC 43226 / DSM 21942 / CIP 109018 / JCM 9157 / 1139) TaxID=1236973 RepID=W4QT77_HALA3|nr:class I SAM-dependent rRNA methyltransferase [Halalkalibacter akibai]GAE34514.1 LSU m5C1962 methyltransferase RlmI [Halalkalibacter akibai JCM 9157]